MCVSQVGSSCACAESAISQPTRNGARALHVFSSGVDTPEDQQSPASALICINYARRSPVSPKIKEVNLNQGEGWRRLRIFSVKEFGVSMAKNGYVRWFDGLKLKDVPEGRRNAATRLSSVRPPLPARRGDQA